MQPGRPGEEEDEGYTITFAGDEGVQEIYIYYTQDYTEADETIQADGTTVSRNSDTGEPDSTGSGQLNFQIILNDGYSLSDVSLSEGTYKNLKGPSDTGQENTYRATKIIGETTVTITTVQCAHENVSNPEWTWADDYSAATLSLDCTDCGNQVSLEGTITSELMENGEVSFTATCSLNAEEYKDIQTASP